MYTTDHLSAMSPEQRQAEFNRLAKRFVGQTLLLHGVKWAMILGTTRALRKVLQR